MRIRTGDIGNARSGRVAFGKASSGNSKGILRVTLPIRKFDWLTPEEALPAVGVPCSSSLSSRFGQKGRHDDTARGDSFTTHLRNVQFTVTSAPTIEHANQVATVHRHDKEWLTTAVGVQLAMD